MNINNGFTAIMSKIKIRKQLYFIFISAVIIPVLFIGTFLTANTLKSLYQQLYAQLASDNLRVKSIMFDTTLNTFNISEDFINDKILQDILVSDYASTGDATQSCDGYSHFRGSLNNNTSIASITVYTTNPTIGNCEYITSSTDEKVQEWYKKVQVPSSSFWESMELKKTVGSIQSTSQELILVRSFPLVNSKYSAIIVIRISNNYLKNRIKNNQLFTAISINKDPIFFSTTRTEQGTAQSVPINYEKNYYNYGGLVEYNGEKKLSVISSFKPYKSIDNIYITSMDFNALDSIADIAFMCTIIILITIIFPLIFIIFYTKYFTFRVNVLRTAMHRASNGDYNIIDIFHGDDELSETFSDLNIMIKNVKKQEAQMYEAQIKEHEIINQQQQTEFKLLASQINPHFIYNTLETIRMMSVVDGNKDVATAIKLLGKSMHYVLENTGTASTTLDKELEYIRGYLAIQKLRFYDRVNYSLITPDDLSLDNYQILPLLLQPIVENAILHGLNEVETNGQIIITIHTKDNELLFIDIFDNGKGMAPEELDLINAHLEERDGTISSSIGLYNVNQRIKLFYGPSYGMAINSSKEEGTLIQLILPLVPANSV